MQFRHLAFSALGPFPGTHSIDFDELTASGLFLFEGPTGSGKSSIIDAIVFALYGKVAGEESDDSRIRSAHADDSTPSFSDLVFTIPAGVFRVKRSPAWTRKKKRGTGTTPVKSSATLWKLSEAAVDTRDWDAGEVLASGARDVGTELSKLLALTREQFVQTVVLPQGEFAQFLRLSSTERSGLLETLFATADYRTFTRALTEKARFAAKKVDEAGNQATRALHGWVDIDGLEQEFPGAATLKFIDADDHGPLAKMSKINELLATRSVEAQAMTTRLRENAEALTRVRQAEEELAKTLEDRQRLLYQQKELEAQKDKIVAKQQKIALHEKVATAVDRLGIAKRAREDLDSAKIGLPAGVVPVKDERTRLADAIEADRDLIEPSGTLIRGCESAISKLTSQIGELKPIAELEVTLADRETALKDLHDSGHKLAAQIEKMAINIDAFPKQKEQLESDISHARERADKIPALEAHRKALDEQHERVTRLESLRNELAVAQKEGTIILEKHGTQQEFLASITAAWRRSSAANLAADLDDGKECPVCGSTEHPKPAQPGDEAATLQDVQAAEKALEPLSLKLQEANEEVARLKGQVQTFESQVNDATKEELSAAVADTKAKLADANAAADTALELNGKLDALVAATEEQRTNLNAKREEHSSLVERIKNASEGFTRDEQAVADARGDAPSIAALRESMETQRSDLEQLKAFAEKVAEHARHAEVTRKAAQESLELSDATEAEAHAAHLDAQRLTELKASVEKYGRETAAIEAQLALARFAEITGEEQPDVARAKAKEAEAQGALREAEKAHTLSHSRAELAALHLERTRQAVKAWKAEADAAGPIVRLANLAEADSLSLNKIRLSTWVLLRRFEQIVDRANEHLREFSFGRYELARTDESGAERKSGLGLEVIHHDAGPQGDHRRSPRTLSGGETFYTSLALALALSEVVQAENGGIRMETLIIDEGFGSLSSEYLQTIMDTLGQLRTGGRTVGIVSHVDELKSMISDRVSVRPLEDGGSTMRVIAGN